MSPFAITLLGLVLYIASGAFYGASLFLEAPSAPKRESETTSLPVSRFGRPLLFLGAAVQFIAIGVWCVTTHKSPFASEFGTFSVLAWAMALAFGLLETRRRLPAVGAVAVTVTSLVLFVALLQARSPVAKTPLLIGQLVSIHVMAILASFGLFAVASSCAVLYILQNRLLKQRRHNALFRKLPPLETLDRTAYFAVAYATPLLTLGLVLGIIRTFGGDLPQPPGVWLRDPHTITALFTWILYLSYFLSRLLLGLRGVRLQYLILLGFLVAFSLYLIPTQTHHFL